MPGREQQRREAYNRSQAAFARLWTAWEAMNKTRPLPGSIVADLNRFIAAERDLWAADREFLAAIHDCANLSWGTYAEVGLLV